MTAVTDHAGDTQRALSLTRLFVWLTIASVVQFAAAGAIANNARLYGAAIACLLTTAVYLVGAAKIRRGNLKGGIVVVGSGVLCAVTALGLLVPEIDAAMAMAMFIPFALTLQFLDDRTPKLMGIVGLVLALLILTVRDGFGWSSGLPLDVMAWVRGIMSVIVLVAIGTLFLQIRSTFVARSERLRVAHEAIDQAKIDKEVAERAAGAKAAFLANMSHEIRTPMNAIIGMTSLLVDTKLQHEQQEFVETIRTSSEHLLGLINDILDFSKLEAGKVELEHAPFDLRACVEDALDLVAMQAHAKDLEIAVDFAADAPRQVIGDPGRLRQVLVNLASNAVKFTERGEIVATVARAGDRVEIVLRDSGIGMSPEEQKRLFQSFSQADSSTSRKYGGTGLGLAISQRLVQAMGGEIRVDSALGAGSTFRFAIPLEVSESPPGTEPAFLHGLRVLVVDDNATNRRILRRTLESWGMAVVDTESPTTALAHATDEAPFAIALLDQNMPEMTGLELAGKLRALEGPRGEARLVMLTSGGIANADKETTVQATLTKPIKHHRLRDTMLALLATAPKSVRIKRTSIELAAETPRMRILLAEDNHVNQKVALALLAKLGQRADVAADGNEAVAAVMRQQYDLVLMDVQMPNLDGISATRQIRAQVPADRQPYIIALTANATDEDRTACLAAGMNACLTKPVPLVQLTAALDTVAKSLPTTPAQHESEHTEPER